MEMNTINIPILGLEEHGGSVMVPDYGASLGISITDELEVPVETVITEDEELQAIEIGNYAVSRPIPNIPEIQNQQPFVIASTDSQGNCYVTMQENYILKANSDSRNVQVPRVTKLPNTNHRIGRRSFIRCGRSRMIADKLTNISVAEFKAQLNDTSDIIGRLDLAPTTKSAMKQLGSNGISKIFSTSGRRIRSSKLLQIFQRHLTTSLQSVEETFSDMTLLPVGYQPEIDPTKIKRITRRRRYPGAEEYQRRMIQQQMQHTFNNLVAESQKSMEAVFMENSTTVAENQDNLQILVDAAQNGTVTNEESQKVVGMFQLEEMNDNSVIVIHNGEEATEGSSCTTQQNIEVLLAAAAGSGFNQDNIHQVIICQPPNSGANSFFPGNSSIIIVPNDNLMDTITETVMTS
ncbi:uncharacterized protein [Anabrus simplex]|uniref:uncharacterized protein n=1 Tax=Anabrus simplex TaxID=316456 RepID=UPI0034DCCB23